MMKMLPILSGLINESNLIELPEVEITNTVNTILVPFIVKELIPIFKSEPDIRIPFVEPYLPDETKDLFILPMGDGEHKISVAFYYNPKDKADARMHIAQDRVVLNLASIIMSNVNSVIIHELTHAVDLKLRKDDVNKKLHAKYGMSADETFKYDNDLLTQDEFDDIFIRYHKDPREFDAHTGQIIRHLRDNITYFDENRRDEIIKMLWMVIKDARTMTSNDLFKKYRSEPVIYLFTDNFVKQIDNAKLIEANFADWIEAFTIWASEPSLYKRFYNRLAKFVPYKV